MFVATHGFRYFKIDFNNICPSAYEKGTISTGGTYMGGVHSGANNMLWLEGHASVWYDVITSGSPPYARNASDDIWRRGL